ncbi:MAG: DUF4258 domain-containing protein [Chitinophagaceae bacterium]
MKPARATFSLIIVILLLAIFVFRRWQEPQRKEAFDRTPPSLKYTRHALCRMDCRYITKEDIRDIMKKGIINFNKSNRQDRPCPTYALQGYTSDGQNLRVIFAQCTEETKVVTCYDLEKDFECHCPGDYGPLSSPPSSSLQVTSTQISY